MRDVSVVDLITSAMAEEAHPDGVHPTPRLCVVGPGRHSPVLGVMTEHLIAALSQQWLVSTVQLAVPGDAFDSTLVGLNAPELVRVPSLVESNAQSRLTRQRRLRRFFTRERPDVVMIDLWSLGQVDWASTIMRAAQSVGARVAVRCCGRLEGPLGMTDRARLRHLLRRIDLLITQGHAPAEFVDPPCPVLVLPELKTEERQFDPSAAEVFVFLPSERCFEAELLLRAFDGLSDQRSGELSLVFAQRAGSQTAELEDLVAASYHHARVSALSDWLSDTQLERRISKTDVAVLFEPEPGSRALDVASHQGIPVVVVRNGNTGPGDEYSGATISPFEPASLLASIERANLARRYRYPQSEDFIAGADHLSERLYELVASASSIL